MVAATRTYLNIFMDDSGAIRAKMLVAGAVAPPYIT